MNRYRASGAIIGRVSRRGNSTDEIIKRDSRARRGTTERLNGQIVKSQRDARLANKLMQLNYRQHFFFFFFQSLQAHRHCYVRKCRIESYSRGAIRGMYCTLLEFNNSCLIGQTLSGRLMQLWRSINWTIIEQHIRQRIRPIGLIQDMRDLQLSIENT